MWPTILQNLFTTQYRHLRLIFYYLVAHAYGTPYIAFPLCKYVVRLKKKKKGKRKKIVRKREQEEFGEA